jgi:hypothetical protein
MFTWICPQCGGEVLPSQDECPRCAKRAAEPGQAVAVPPVATAAPVQATPVPASPAPRYTPPEEPRSTGLRDLLVTVGVAAVLLGVGYFFWTRAERRERAASETKAGLETAAGARNAHPLSKQIEVAGFRLRMPKPGQAEVQMLVVNHSAAEIAGLSMDVVLMAKGTSKEIAVLPVTVKRLSPFGSAEVTAKGKTLVSAIDLPDWQFLEARVVVQGTEP